jgi:acyl-CoA reductase-like NAD-dependent aldehyde dehydrogenase
MAPAIVSGNTAVIIASESRPLVSITFAEALATSDLPAGVVNILTGFKKELVPWLAAHMDVNLIDGTGLEEGDLGKVIQLAADSVKRFVRFDSKKYGWDDQKYAQSLYSISDFLEIKTVWHPMGM